MPYCKFLCSGCVRSKEFKLKECKVKSNCCWIAESFTLKILPPGVNTSLQVSGQSVHCGSKLFWSDVGDAVVNGLLKICQSAMSDALDVLLDVGKDPKITGIQVR